MQMHACLLSKERQTGVTRVLSNVDITGPATTITSAGKRNRAKPLPTLTMTLPFPLSTVLPDVAPDGGRRDLTRARSKRHRTGTLLRKGWEASTSARSFALLDDGSSVLRVSGHVFISYSHTKDGPYVESLAAHLQAAGVPVWYDSAIESGDRFSAIIQKAIDDCAVFVPVLTPASAESEWVRRELSRAVRLRKPVWPLLRAACDPPVEVEGLHHEDATDGRMPDSAFVTRLRNLATSGPPPATAPPPGEAASSQPDEAALPRTDEAALPRTDEAALPRTDEAALPRTDEAALPRKITRRSLLAGGAALAGVAGVAGALFWQANGARSVTLPGLTPTNGAPSINGTSPTATTSINGTPSAVGPKTGGPGAVGASNPGAPRPPTGTLIRTLTDSTDRVWAVAYSPDSTVVAAGGVDRAVWLWRADTGRLMGSLPGHDAAVNAVAYSLTSPQLATASDDNTVRVWRADNGEFIRALPHDGEVYSVAYSFSSAELATACADTKVRVWRADNGTLVRTLTGHTLGAVSVAYSPSLAQLASGGDDGTVRIWRTDTGADVRTLTGHYGTVASVAYSMGTNQLATAGYDGSVHLWRADTGVRIRTLIEHQNSFYSVAYSPDGTQLAAANQDGTVRIWNAGTGAQIWTHTFTDGAYCVAYSPDGAQFATAGADKLVRTWYA
jgi:WD40 repeat protein